MLVFFLLYDCVHLDTQISEVFQKTRCSNFEISKTSFIEKDKFSGELPLGISNVLYLNDLYLQHNQFSGQVPEQFGRRVNIVQCCRQHVIRAYSFGSAEVSGFNFR